MSLLTTNKPHQTTNGGTSKPVTHNGNGSAATTHPTNTNNNTSTTTQKKTQLELDVKGNSNNSKKIKINKNKTVFVWGWGTLSQYNPVVTHLTPKLVQSLNSLSIRHLCSGWQHSLITTSELLCVCVCVRVCACMLCVVVYELFMCVICNY